MILTIPDPVYMQDVLVAIGETSETRIVTAALKSGYHVPNPESLAKMLEMTNADGRTIGDRDTGLVIIRLHRVRRGHPTDLSTLVHECVHAGTILFDRIGFPLKNKTDEPFAYYVAFLVRSILEKMK